MKKLLFLTFSMFAPLFITAQVELMDLSIVPTIKLDTVTGNVIVTANAELSISFKINNENQASKVHILFGTNQNIGDILTVEADIIENSGVYYILLNGEQTPISNYSAKTAVTLTPQQLSSYNFITLYVEETSGSYTDKLYFVK